MASPPVRGKENSTFLPLTSRDCYKSKQHGGERRHTPLPEETVTGVVITPFYFLILFLNLYFYILLMFLYFKHIYLPL